MDLNKISTLFVTADLVADSVLHVGAGDYLDYKDTASLYRDGAGRPVLPGSSLAGVFMDAAALSAGKDSPMSGISSLWPRITGKGSAKNDFMASALEFATLPLVGEHTMPKEWWTHERDHVGIERRTGTAAHGAKFAFEVLEPGLRFRLTIRCDLDVLNNVKERAALCRLLIAVLDRSWGPNGPGGIIGANSARGMGWFHLEHLRFIPIDSSNQFRAYLETKSESAWLDECLQKDQYLDVTKLQKAVGNVNWRPPVHRWEFTLSPRVEPDGYGRWPAIVRSSPGMNTKEADLEFTSVRRWRLKEEGKWSYARVPVIPGSSVRGAARSLLERLAATVEIELDRDEVERLFGTAKSASPLRFRDALFQEEYHGREKEYETQLERIGLDEFTRGVYGSAKFNYIPVFYGHFEGGAALRMSKPSDEETELLDLLFEWGGEDMPWLGIGGGASPMIWRRGNAA